MLHITKLERLDTGLYEENECCEYVTRGCTDNTYILHNLLIDPISKVDYSIPGCKGLQGTNTSSAHCIAYNENKCCEYDTRSPSVS